jgi:antitoxin (DNA-binding transcriptional repressor) of toxin-antitoxin stability system
MTQPLQRSQPDAEPKSDQTVDQSTNWSQNMTTMKTIGAASFKAHCLRILDSLDPEGIVVTKHGKPVARVLPIPDEPHELIGSLKGKIKIKGDIMSTGSKWEAGAEP